MNSPVTVGGPFLKNIDFVEEVLVGYASILVRDFLEFKSGRDSYEAWEAGADTHGLNYAKFFLSEHTTRATKGWNKAGHLGLHCKRAAGLDPEVTNSDAVFRLFKTCRQELFALWNSASAELTPFGLILESFVVLRRYASTLVGLESVPTTPSPVLIKLMASSSEKPWLNTYGLVESILRSHAAQLFEEYGKYKTGVMEPEAAHASLVERSKHLADIFLGKTELYSTALWNTPPGVGRYVHHAGNAKPTTSYDDAVFSAIMNFAFELLDLAKLIDEGRKKEDLKLDADAAIETYTHLLTGIPYPHDPECPTALRYITAPNIL